MLRLPWLVLLFVQYSSVIHAENADKDDDRWDSLVHWTGGGAPLRATLVRSPAGRLLPSPGGRSQDCKHTVGDFNEELVVELDEYNNVVYVRANVDSYRPGFNGSVGAQSVIWRHDESKLRTQRNSVILHVHFADAELVLRERWPDVKYSMESNKLLTTDEHLKEAFVASNKTLSESSPIAARILPDGTGGGWFENAAASINVTNSTAGRSAVGRLNDDLTFELRPKWFRVNGRTGQLTVEQDLDSKSTVLEVKLNGGRTARLFSPSRKLIALRDRYEDAHEVRIFADGNRRNPTATVRFDAQNLRADNFSYNFAGRLMTMADGGGSDEDRRGPEQLTIAAGRSVRLSDARQVLRLTGRTISCQDSAARISDDRSERKTEFTASAGGFHINLADSILDYDRTAGVLWINTTAGYARIDIASRRVTPNDMIRSETSTLASSLTELRIGKNMVVRVEFGAGYVHIRYDITVHLKLVGASGVETDVGEASWTSDGGFSTRCAGGPLHGAVQPAARLEKKEGGAVGQTEWLASGRRVSATIAADGTVYARNYAREFAFTTTEKQIELSTYGARLEIV